MFRELDAKKELLDSRGPLPENKVKRIREDLMLEWIYNSNLMEFNSFTLMETKVALDGVTVGGKTIREHIEVVNDKEAILYIEKMLRDNEQLAELQIQKINRILLNGINAEYAGKYRGEQAKKPEISSLEAEPILIKERMENFLRWYNTDAQELHPLERAAMVYILFAEIQPFIDGNGRTARLLLNFEIMKSGYLPVVFSVDYIDNFRSALDKACTDGDSKRFIEIIRKEAIKAFDTYLRAI